ncbi:MULTISPECIES: alpha-xenorhabdolysin family binary toxin subunit A [unclassified Pseudomonas]|uniref:alpha-xenorhabdolysin family binary toxin subunit A n=1 Tax=unclassified Pseudomonas TaxID=196821 RepID=UPI000BA3DA12|nr:MULTISPECIES: alpha-xenorhabdolysin family binary toxin subunit A [unclassified Pseudomonas]MCU1721220.1 alpha-xenorhabdolysin family binary toxin subunit A [Pseudomonas sp. 5P_5.1_Bac1]MCU1732181.1 alpha-xenorhabdolysin family binary toxin subunit A [Pseudomonas sp. 20P_3.2_Bac4]MCU1744850.1 alpha-xenorhabdolysin family binary toxin subunit A [Pseudomonas sp. 20P_3.2_Bac5]
MIIHEQNESLQALDSQQRAEFVPKQYFDVISRRTEKNRMQPALIFTADNLRSIKRYVEYVYRLPKSADEISEGHNFALLGLDANLVLRHYASLRKHAEAWDIIERESKRLGTQLEQFAKEFLAQGDHLLSALKSTAAYGRLSERLVDVMDDVTLQHLPYRVLDSKDQAQIVNVGVYLSFIREDIDEAKQDIATIKERAIWFTDAVVKQLRPEIDWLMQRLNNVEAEKIISTLRAEIEPMDGLIAQKSAEYQALVGYAFSGLAFGLIGVAITGGIYGAQAEQVRAEKNELICRRDALAQKIAAISPMIGSFEKTSLQIADLKFRLTEVQTAAKNLEDVWSMLGVYVEESEEEMRRIDTDIKLATFIHRFERVVRPWESIRGLSAQLSRIFNETLDEISRKGALR